MLDGAMGTMVEDEGVDVGQALWGSAALLAPEDRALVSTLHRRYVEAGARLIIANTHNASVDYCRRHLDARPRETWPPAARGPDPARALMSALNREAMALARAAAQPSGARVAACVASADVPYTRSATRSADALAARLRPQVELLDGLGPALLVFEMNTTSADLEAIARLAPELGVPLGVGLVFGEDGRLLGGMSPEAALASLEPARPAAVFVQCTRWDLVEEPLAALAAAAPADLVFGAYGNDGRQWTGSRWVGPRVSPQVYAAAAARWRQLGARIIGGCCGTTPAHVAALRARLAD